MDTYMDTREKDKNNSKNNLLQQIDIKELNNTRP